MLPHPLSWPLFYKAASVDRRHWLRPGSSLCWNCQKELLGSDGPIRVISRRTSPTWCISTATIHIRTTQYLPSVYLCRLHLTKHPNPTHSLCVAPSHVLPDPLSFSCSLLFAHDSSLCGVEYLYLLCIPFLYSNLNRNFLNCINYILVSSPPSSSHTDR